MATFLLFLFLCFHVALLQAEENDQLSSPSAMYQHALMKAFADASRTEFDRNRHQKSYLKLEEPLNKLIYILKNGAAYYKAADADDNGCMQDMNARYEAAKLGEDWAKKFFDSNAVKPSGFMSGNYLWLGDFDQCRSIHHQNGGQLKPKYCRVALSAPNATFPPQTLQINPTGFILGVCVSSRCQINQLAPIINPLARGFNMEINEAISHCFEDDVPYNTISIVTITLFSLLGLALFIGLAVDISIQLSAWLKKQLTSSLPVATAETEETLTKMELETPPKQHNQNKASTTIIKVALFFSPYSNFLKVMNVPKEGPCESGSNLTAINAIRSLSLFWVILGHSYIFVYFLVDNLNETNTIEGRATFMFVIAATFAVDTFLFLSGFLAYWSMAKQFKKLSLGSFWKSLPLIYFHRYIRLTVPYLALILIDLGLWAHFSSAAGGPFYFQGTDYNCATNWWTNLLYINNIIDTSHLCLTWTWYLAIDMQLFLLTPFVIFLFVKKPALGWLVCVAALIMQFAFAIALTFGYNLPSITTPPMMNLNTTGAAKNHDGYFGIYYIKPYTRLGPYVIGIMCAHLAIKHAATLKNKIFGNTRFSSFMWGLMFAILLANTYGQFGIYSGKYVDPTIWEALFNAFAKTAWGCAIGWLLLACAFNSAGPIGSVLSWPVWAVPARLSYSAYLLHPMVLMFYGQTSRRTFNSTDMTTIFLFLAATFATLLASIVFTLAFESPFVGLLRLLIPRGKSKKPASN